MTDNTRVFNLDCMIGMEEFPDKYFDLAICDPPFTGTYDNKTIPRPDYYEQLERISKRSIIWGCQYMLPFLNAEGSFIVWNKKADPDLHNMSSCDIAWYSKRDRIRIFDGHWCGAVKCETEPTIHIHQKPISLYKWLLYHYAETGDKILDTHLGSQSSRIAAFDMGFDFTGYELDKDYFEAGNKRFANHKAQLKIRFYEPR